MEFPELPNLAGVATSNLVENLKAGTFNASYINWSRTVHLLREHAPGWLPEIVLDGDNNVLHHAPVGAFLLIRFRKGDAVTPAIPQAVMDSRNAAIPYDKITARDITDTHRRGICLAAAMTFGLAYELWAKMPLESGYDHESEPPSPPPPVFDKEVVQEVVRSIKDSIEDGNGYSVRKLLNLTKKAGTAFVQAVWAGLSPEEQDYIQANFKKEDR